MNKNEPLFLIPSHDPIIQSWNATFHKLEQSKDEPVFTVNPTIADEGQVAFIQQMVMALQHYPNLIERMVFAVKFKFMLVDDVPVEVSENEWKMSREVYDWFFQMNMLPVMIYFISDQDARSYCLFGDILASGNYTYHEEPDGHHKMIAFTEEQAQLIMNRLFHSAWAFLMYCHNTGFNPDKYIDALLADFDMPFTVADVRKKYDEDIERGIRFRMVPQA